MIISEIVKEGKITQVIGEKARVAVACGDDACGGCRISSLCGKSGASIELNARIEEGVKAKNGEKVIVIGRLKGWMTSWLLLAGLPCVAILGALIGGFAIGLSDIMVGMGALAVTAAYFGILWTMRDRIERRVEWIVTSSNQCCH